MWSRTDVYAQWSLVHELSYPFRARRWAWLEYQSEGEWGAFGRAVKAYRRG